MKTLIAFASKGKTTEEYARVIESVLSERGFEPDFIDLMKGAVDTSKYDNVIVGFGVRAGKPYREALEILKGEFKGKKVAIFVSTLETLREAKKKYTDPLISGNHSIGSAIVGVFGGRFKIFWKVIADKTDIEKARKWAEHLAKKLKA